MPRRRSWPALGFAAWRLGADAALVVGLRLAKLAALDRSAEAEARLMVNEKIAAASSLAARALRGGLSTDPARLTGQTLDHYARAVARNRKRLGKARRAK